MLPHMTPPIAFITMPQGPELFIILGILILFFGAKKLPELARGLGQSINEFRRGKGDFDPPPSQQTPPPAEGAEKKSGDDAAA